MKVLFGQDNIEFQTEEEAIQIGAQNLENGSNGNPELEYNYNLKVGDEAPSGGRINHIYAHEKDKYLIYSTDRFKRPIVIAEMENLLTDNPGVCKELLQIRDLKENDPHLKNKYNEAYAQALRTLLDGHPESGLESLRTLRTEMENYLKREATYFYLIGAAVATFLVLIVHLGFYMNESYFRPKTQEVFYAVLFATIGGFLSVATGSRKINVELQNDEVKKAIYGALRIAIAIFSGVLVYYAIRGGLALEIVKTSNSMFALYFLCAAAGFLEKLVPNLMHNLENKNDGKERQKINSSSLEATGRKNVKSIPQT
jgi:hypothetical protein